MSIEQRYTSFEKAKNYSKQYELDSVDSIVTKQEDGYLGYISAGQFATTGSNIFTGGQILIGNLTIDGDIYANQFNVTTTSIEHFTASTRFGLDMDDTHTFTGSVYITGSLNVIGANTTLGNTTITGSTKVDYIIFNSQSATPLVSYMLQANTTDKTLDLRMGANATLQLGQEMYFPLIVNKSGVDLYDGDLVMVNPAGIAQGNRISVVKAITDGTYAADKLVGILTEDVVRNAEGFATWFGYVRDLDKTRVQPAGETWAEGDILYPNPAIPGRLTKVFPTAPNLRVTVATITAINGNNVTVLVNFHKRTALKRAHDVLDNSTTSSYGDILVKSGSVWTNLKTLNGDYRISGSLFVSGTTEFGGNLVPKFPSGSTLGTVERPFRDIFLQSASINIASDVIGGRGASISNADGNVTIQAAGLQLKSGSFVSFEVSEDARTKIRVPQIPAGDIGAFSIIGNSSGSYQPVTNAGGLIHLTGNDGLASRITSDAFGTTALVAYVGRKARGTAETPLPVQSNDTLTRISSIGWTGPEYGFTMLSGLTTAPTSLDVIALENFTTSSFGTAYRLFNTPIGNTTRVLSAQIDTSGLFVSGTFTSSLEEGYFWVGGNGNRTKLIPTASYATTGSNTFSGSQVISGSLYVSESLYVTNEIYLNGNKLFNYAQFSDTTTQSGSANTAYSMKFNTTDISHNISVVSGSRITVDNTGIYNLQFSAQLDHSANTNEIADIWIAVTGSNVPNSNTRVAINKAQAGNEGKVVAAWNYMLPLSASNYVEIKWSATGNGIILAATGSQSNPTRPAVPSVIATITQIA